MSRRDSDENLFAADLRAAINWGLQRREDRTYVRSIFRAHAETTEDHRAGAAAQALDKLQGYIDDSLA